MAEAASTEDAILEQTGITEELENESNLPLEEVSDGDSGDQGTQPTGASTEGTGTPASTGSGDGTTQPAGNWSRHPLGYGVDANNNVVDPNTGAILARAGSERRVFEQAHRLRDEVQQRDSKIRELETQLQTATTGSAEALNGLPQRYGLDAASVETAFQIAAGLKADPVGTLKLLLTQAQASGHNIDGIGASTDVAAIQQMINEAVRPLTEQQRQQQELAQQNTESERVYREFMSAYPNAIHHQPTIATLMEKGNLSPTEAYLRLENWCLTNGLDPSKPIEPQVAARQNGQSNGNVGQPNGQSGAPMPNGSGMLTPTGDANTSVEEQSMLADPDASYDSIVRAAIAESGYTAQ